MGLWETGSYWGDVGQVFKGYGNAAVNTAKGIGHVVSHPIQTAQGVGHAVTHPKQTFNALKADVGTKLQSNAGSGEIVGDVLIGIATGGALKAASKTGTVAKVAENLNVRNRTPDATTGPGGDSARTITLEHGTTRNRAESLMDNPPDPSVENAGGFSTAQPGGPNAVGSPDAYAGSKATAFPDEGGPAVLRMEVPEDIYNKAYDPMMGKSEVRFDSGYGLEELQKDWSKIEKNVRDAAEE